MNDGFFASEVGLFRALKDFLVQFGLPGDPQLLKKFHAQGNLIDDPPWLPLGPTGREINGKRCSCACAAASIRCSPVCHQDVLLVY